MKTTRKTLLFAAVASMCAAHTYADERLFTYSYEAEVLPKGGLEFEQWVTHRRDKADGVFSRWDFREELEYGLTDRLTTALYLNFRDTTETTETVEAHDFEFKGISSEWKYQILNPNTKPIGLLGYGEITYNGSELELEEKLILQKNFGERWVTVFNAILEQEWEWEGDDEERELAVEFTAGVSYRLNKNWALGIEGRHHRVYADFDDEIAKAWFVGPVVHYGSGKWWGTLTVLPQVAGSPDMAQGLELDEHTKVEVRLIAGYNF
jgi:hypothetical protein